MCTIPVRPPHRQLLFTVSLMCCPLSFSYAKFCLVFKNPLPVCGTPSVTELLTNLWGKVWTFYRFLSYSYMNITSISDPMVELGNDYWVLFGKAGIWTDVKMHLLDFLFQYFSFLEHFLCCARVKIVKFRGRSNEKFFVRLAIPLKYVLHTSNRASGCLLYCGFWILKIYVS